MYSLDDAINAMSGASDGLLDISHIKPNNKFYGGLACTKVGVTINGIDYMVKYTSKPRTVNSQNTALLYPDSAVSEYLGSYIFKLFGINTHNVQLVRRDNKICAMCEDFKQGRTLVEFREIKQSYSPGFFIDGDSYDGVQTELVEILEVIRCNQVLKDLSYEDFFWKMFIIDMIIGNHDRNTGNFGILQDSAGNASIAPVYDNGNAFNLTWDDVKMLSALEKESTMQDIAYNAYACRFTDCGKQINPFQYLSKRDNKSISNALDYVLQYDANIFKAWIKTQCCITDTQKQFYCKLLDLRFELLRRI